MRNKAKEILERAKRIPYNPKWTLLEQNQIHSAKDLAEEVLKDTFPDELSETQWLVRKASMNLDGCIASWKHRGSKGYRLASEYLPEALGFTEEQLTEALERVKALRKKTADGDWLCNRDQLPEKLEDVVELEE